MVLRGAAHEEQASRGKIHPCALLAVASVSEMESAGRSETDGGDDGIDTQLRFVVAVPTHTVSSVAVEVQQYRVEGGVA